MLLNCGSVLFFHQSFNGLVYFANAALLFLAALSIRLLFDGSLPRVVRARMQLWCGFLLCYGMAYLWAAYRQTQGIGKISYAQILLYAISYALAFLTVVSPPSGRRWNLHCLLDFLQAAVLAAMFFETSLKLHQALYHLIFTAVLQLFLFVAALIASYASKSSAEQKFNRYVAVYFVIAALFGVLANIVDLAGSPLLSNCVNALYPLDSFAALALTPMLNLQPHKRLSRPPHATAEMPVLTTGAVLFLCIPILRLRNDIGIVLMASAFLLFSVRMSLVLRYREKERLERLAENRELRKIALTDPLTGIANRRAFIDALNLAVKNASTAGPAFTLIALDLDDLKRINDNEGHKAGDRAIHACADALRRLSQVPFDQIGRLGGDEFAVILPFEKDVPLWIDEIRETLRENRLAVSIGVARCTLDMKVSAEGLLEVADFHLYREKQSRSSGRHTKSTNSG